MNNEETLYNILISVEKDLTDVGFIMVIGRVVPNVTQALYDYH